jgi:hypothetical protein
MGVSYFKGQITCMELSLWGLQVGNISLEQRPGAGLMKVASNQELQWPTTLIIYS